MVDSPRAIAGSRLLQTRFGPRHICGSTIRFAARAGLPIYFCATDVTRHYNILTRIAAPDCSSPEAIRNEFCGFLRRVVAPGERERNGHCGIG